MRAYVIVAVAVLLVSCRETGATSGGAPTASAISSAIPSAAPPSVASDSGGPFFDDAPPIPSDAPVSSAQVDAGLVSYTTYANDRFHFSIDVPSFFDKSPAQANGAGQSFTWKGKGSMRVWGAPNSQHWAPTQYFDDFTRRPGVADKEQKDDWWRVAGKDRGRNFYTKGFVTPAALVAVMIDYDDVVKDTMDVVARHIGDSLKIAK